jgi:hypothetical protein
LLDGTYRFYENISTVESAPKSTLILASILQSLLDLALANKSEDELITNIASLPEEYAGITSLALKAGGMPTLVTVLIILLSQCSVSLHETINWNVAIDQIRVYLTGAEPYPFPADHVESQNPPELKTEPSRQQRRHLERRNEKNTRKRGKP